MLSWIAFCETVMVCVGVVLAYEFLRRDND